MDTEENLLYKKEPEEMVIEIEVERLRDFRDHPYKIQEDQQMKSLKESIQRYGILTPLIVRPVPEGYYEIISGHRRRFIAKLLGFRKVPVIIRVMKDDEAVIAMVDANNQREAVSLSEKAFAYKMKYEAMKRTSGRKKESGGQDGYHFQGKKTVEILGEQGGDSAKQVQRYLRIPELLPDLITKVDKGELSFNPAVELSYLSREDQQKVLDAMNYTQAKPSLSQAQRMKKAGQENNLTAIRIKEILMEDKKRMSDRIVLDSQLLHEYFPYYYTMEMMYDKILELLSKWKSRREKKRGKTNV